MLKIEPLFVLVLHDPRVDGSVGVHMCLVNSMKAKNLPQLQRYVTKANRIGNQPCNMQSSQFNQHYDVTTRESP